MYGYDEQQVVEFAEDVVEAYKAAGADPDIQAVGWLGRMQFDAVYIDYPLARLKHLGELCRALGLYEPKPDAPDPVVDISTPGAPGWDVPRNVDFNNPNQLFQFVLLAKEVAYHGADDETIAYWEDKAQEMLDRGAELGSEPPERYYWERLLGRGVGGDYTAIDGPYKGLENYEGSLTYPV